MSKSTLDNRHTYGTACMYVCCLPVASKGMMEAEPCVGPPSGDSAWVHCLPPSLPPSALDRQPSGSDFALKSSTHFTYYPQTNVLANIIADEIVLRTL